MIRKFAFPLPIAILLAGCETVSSSQAQRTDICEIARDGEAMEGQAILVSTKISNTGNHGFYAVSDFCSETNVPVYPRADPEQRTLSALCDASNRAGILPEKIATFEAVVVVKEWRLWGTDVVRMRPMLEITEVIEWEAAE